VPLGGVQKTLGPEACCKTCREKGPSVGAPMKGKDPIAHTCQVHGDMPKSEVSCIL